MSDSHIAEPVRLKDVAMEAQQPGSSQPIIYKIENLTIHNHGTLNLLCDKPLEQQQQQQPAPSSDTRVSDPTIQWDRREAEIYFENKFPVPVKGVWLWHQYGSDSPEEKMWYDLGPGQKTKDPLTVAYWTGFGAVRFDGWKLKLMMPDGTVFQTSEKLCQLKEIDEKALGSLTFYVNHKFEFQIQPRSVRISLRSCLYHLSLMCLVSE